VLDECTAAAIVAAMRSVAVVLAVGCGAAAPTPAPALAVDRPDVRPVPTLVGRVVADGVALPSFVIKATRDVTPWEPALPVKRFYARDGRFRFALPTSGSWSVVVASRGFVRAFAFGNDVAIGETLDLGDFELERGHVIEGTVRDRNGAPVADARVTLVSDTADLDEDEDAGLTDGMLSAVTAADGSYRLEGEAQASAYGPPSIRATTNTYLASHAVKIANRDATVDINVLPTGSIDVIAPGFAGTVLIEPCAECAMILARRDDDDVFWFNDVPIGDYAIELLDRGWTRVAVRLVTVTERAVTTVTAGSP
jgi:hypothetical protein